MKRILFAAMIMSCLSAQKASAQIFTFPPYNTTPGCFDGSNYTLDVIVQIDGVRIGTIYSDNGSSGSFAFEVLLSGINLITGTVGTSATNFYTYTITTYSDNTNLASGVISNNLTMPIASGSGSNVSLNNNDTYNGSASAMGLTANTTYSSQSVIDLFGFDSLTLNIAGPCLSVSASGNLGAVLLPIKLKDFYATNMGSAININWATEQEENNVGFELQKSSNGGAWVKQAFIASKAAQGNSATALTYRFQDDAPHAGNNFYRLKQMDNDGTYSYSKTAKVHFGGAALNQSLAIYPLPASDFVYVYSSGISPNTAAMLTDITGKVCLQTLVSFPETKIDVSHLPNGTYLLRAGDVVSKVVVLR